MRDHTWKKWKDIESRYLYEIGEKKYTRQIRSVGADDQAARMSGFISWVFILKTQGVDLPHKFRESDWDRGTEK